MKAAMLAIGSEITGGYIINSNAAYVSSKLKRINIETIAQIAIPDDNQNIVAELNRLMPKVDILIVSGGLGPTTDDLTRDAIAEAFDIEYAIDEELLKKLVERYEKLNMKMPVNNEVQFSYPKENGIIIPNDVGVALGFMITKFEGKLIAVLPGVPRELYPMFDGPVLSEISKRFEIKEKIFQRILKCFGAYESIIDDKIKHLCAPDKDPQGGIQSKDAIIILRFKTEDADEDRAKMKLSETVKEIRKILGPIVFGEGNDELNNVVVQLLADSGLKVGVAESCTAGLVTNYLGRIPGVSSYLKESVIAYSNEAKIERLGVSEELFSTHGSVSSEVAVEMARGLLKTSNNVDVAVSVTGVAGPGGATEAKPVGLVYIAIALKNKKGEVEREVVRKYQLRGEREIIQNRAALCALNLLRLFLIDRLDVPDLGSTP